MHDDDDNSLVSPTIHLIMSPTYIKNDLVIFMLFSQSTLFHSFGYKILGVYKTQSGPLTHSGPMASKEKRQ